MQKLLPAASFLLLSLMAVVALRASAPAQAAQGDAAGGAASSQALEARVSALELELQLQKTRNDEGRLLLEQTQAYLEKQSKAAQALLATLDVVEQQGFAFGENWRSRETLLAGMRAYWGDALTGLPKLPAPVPPKPTVPARVPRK